MTRKKLRYALDDEAPEPGVVRRVRPWSDVIDNPLSPQFREVQFRSEQDRARWWAQIEKRKKGRAVSGQFDPA